MTAKTFTMRSVRLFPRLMIICILAALGVTGMGAVGYRGIAGVNRDLRDIYELRMKSLSALYELQLAQTTATVGYRALLDREVQDDSESTANEGERIEAAVLVFEETVKLYQEQRRDSAEEQIWRQTEFNLSQWDESQKALLEIIQKQLESRKAKLSAVDRAFLDRTVMDRKRVTDDLWAQCNEGLTKLIDLNVTAVGGLYQGSQRSTRAMLRMQVVGAVVILIVILALTSVTARTISGPLHGLIRVTRGIVRTGSLDQEIDTSGCDELSELAGTFQEMVQRLRVIPAAASEVANAVKDLTQLITDQTEAVQRQSSGLTQVTATMQEIRQTSSTASSSAETVIEVAKRAEAASGAGQGAVESSLQSLEEIRTQIDGIVAKITDLAERTLLVGGIIETVKDLADHSNMLALNASIEAVKAGELGKGFGVVAREIRSLADQSIQATASIREVLTEIQGAIRSTVSMADRGKKDMDRSMQQIRSSGHSLTELSGVVTQTSQSARQIAASVRQQNIGITQIAGTLEELNAAMQWTTEGINGAKAAAARLTKLANRVDETLRPAASRVDASSGEPTVNSDGPPT